MHEFSAADIVSMRSRVVIGTFLLALIVWLWWMLPVAVWVDTIRVWILRLGAIGLVAFVFLYILITVVLGPASALTLAAGYAYGAWGFPLVVGSATLAAAIAFLLGRYVAQDRVNHWISKDPRLQSLNRAVSDEGWRVVGLMRLSPLIPYGMQNYLFSMTQVRFVPFVLATLIGIMPATALYVYIGSLGQGVGKTGALQWALAIVGLLVTLLVAWVIGKRVKVALAVRALDQ